MDFAYLHPGLGEEQRMIVETVEDFAREQLAPRDEEIDASARIPDEVLGQLAELGLLAIPVPEDRGGAGFDYVSYAFALAGLAAGSASTALHVLVQSTHVLEPLARFGETEAATSFRDAVAAGESRGCAALLEESHALDGAGIESVWEAGRLTGGKPHVLGGAEAAAALVVAREGEGLSAFLVDLAAPGASREPRPGRLGVRGVGSAHLVFDGVEVGEERRVGAAGAGAEVFAFVHARAMVALTAVACGLIRAARDHAARYSTERQQFRRPIGDFEAVRERLAGIECGHAATVGLVAHLARLVDAGADFLHLAEVAKVTAADHAMAAADHALQIFGGYGYSQEYPVERLYRDARYLAIAQGGNDAARLRIADRVRG